MRQMKEAGAPPVLRLFEWIIVLQDNIYMILSLILLWRYSEYIKNSLSSLEKINLSWLRHMTMATAFVWALVLFLNVLPLLGISVMEQADRAIAPTTAVFIYVIGYLSLRQKEVSVVENDAGPGQKYQKSGLSSKLADDYLARLLKLMEGTRLYTRDNLTLNELGVALLMRSHLSVGAAVKAVETA